MEHEVEDVTLENFNDIYKIIMSYTFFESLLFRDFGLNQRSFLDLFLFVAAIILSIFFICCHILTFQWDIGDGMIQVAIMCHSFGLIVRIITVTIYRKEIVALISVNFREFNSNKKRPNSSLDVLKESYVYLENIDKFLKGSYLVLLASWYLAPAMFSKSFLGLIEGRNGIEEFLRALPSTFPEKDTSITIHMLSWGFHIIFGLMVISIWATLDVLCFGVTILMEQQYGILQESLFWHKGTLTDSTEPLKLKEFVQDHVKLIRMTNMLRDILGPVVGAQMMHAMFVTACVAYIAAVPTTESGKQFIGNFVAYSLLLLLELFAFCWLSHIANQANENLGFVIYHSSLNEPLDKGNKYWFLPLLMSQKTIKYKALGLVEIDIQTFLAVLKTSYSYFTLMQAKT